MGTLHLEVNVFVFLEDYMPLGAEEVYLLFSSLDSKWAHLVRCEEIFNSRLELLTPLWQAVLGIRCSAAVRTARRWCTLLGNCSQLLGDSLRWSDHELVCLALVRTCSDKLKTALHNGNKALGD